MLIAQIDFNFSPYVQYGSPLIIHIPFPATANAVLHMLGIPVHLSQFSLIPPSK